MAAIGTWVGCQGPIEARIGLFGQPVPHTWSYRGPILPRFARNLTLEHALMAAVGSWVGCQGPFEGRIFLGQPVFLADWPKHIKI